MKAKITNVKTGIEGAGVSNYLVCFKCEDGKSARTWLKPQYGNFVRWDKVIQKYREPSTKEVWLDNLMWKDSIKRIIDADSRFGVQILKGEEDGYIS